MPIGPKVGAYEVIELLGEGGMGQVYRARDTQLGRDVAIKILPEAFAADPDRLMRFEREARTLAALNHPHVAQVYGLESSGSSRAIVMELVDGDDLAARIAHGPLSIDDTIAIGRQIADALEAAHDLGIVHRDLKPANIKLTRDGRVKVLDFGLAKAFDTQEHSSMTAAITSPAMTQAGVILGTAAYMAPEQAKGRPVDERADIWAFGCVLYEMLTGRRLFSGDSTNEVIGAVLRQDIDLSAMPADTPRPVRRLVRRCLERDPKQRLHHIADARIELTDAIDAPQDDEAIQAGPHRGAVTAWLGWGVAAALAAALGAVLFIGGFEPTLATPAYRFTVPPPPGSDEKATISPDGRYLVYATAGPLVLRAFDEGEMRAIDGTDGAREPFWSPDSRSIAFFAGDALKRVAVSGGPPQTLATVPRGWPAGTWSTNGTILVEVTENSEQEGWFALTPGSASLKTIKTFAKDRAINPDKAFPWFLPDGDHFLYTHPVDSVATLHVGSISSDETRPLIAADSRAVYAAGFVLFVRGGTLLAQPFDAAALTLTGEPVTLLDDVRFFSPTGEAWFSVSQTGTLVFRRRDAPSTLRWFDRGGRQAGTLLEPGHYFDATISGNGKRLALQVVDPRLSTSDIWTVDLDRNVPERLTSSPRAEMDPRLSADGSRVVFSTDWQGPPNLYVADVDGGQPRVLVPFDRTQQTAGGWTPDGRQVVYAKRNDSFGLDIWVVDVTSGEHRPVLATEFNESRPSVSPNAKWLAYMSNASGRREVYVREFPGGQWQVRVSVDGGSDPVWRSDGQELFYHQPDGSIMAVPVAAGASGRAVAGVPTRLFTIDERTYRSFDVAPGGQRFLLNLVDPGSVSRPDEVVVDWMRLMRKP